MGTISITRKFYYFLTSITFALIALYFFWQKIPNVYAQGLVPCDPARGIPCTFCYPVDENNPSAGCRPDFNASTCNNAGYSPNPAVCASLPFPCNAGQPAGNCTETRACANLGENCNGAGSCCPGQGECEAASGVCKLPQTCSALGATCNGPIGTQGGCCDVDQRCQSASDGVARCSQCAILGQTCGGPAGTSGGCCNTNHVCQQSRQGGLRCEPRQDRAPGYYYVDQTVGCQACFVGSTHADCFPSPRYASYADCHADNFGPPPTNDQTDSFAVPEPIVPCLEEGKRTASGNTGTRNPEFHSMRPYQASPCADSPKTYFCNNDYIIAEDVGMRWDPSRCSLAGSGGQTFYGCTPEPNAGNVFIIGGPGGKDYQIGLSGVDYPILGNTENVANSQTNRDQMGHPQKVNEYLRWYLEGVIEKAEYGGLFPPNYESYTGPVKKLVPQDFIHFEKLKRLRDAGVHAHPPFQIDPDEYQGGEPVIDPETGNVIVDETSMHDQIAVCANDGSGVALPCYPSGGNAKANDIWRLTKWWESRGSTPGQNFFQWTDNDVWSGNTPPFPWQFRKSIYYMKAYSEWRGASCVIKNEQLYCLNIGNIQINACTSVAENVCGFLFAGFDELGIDLIVNLRNSCVSNLAGQCTTRADFRNNLEGVCTSLISSLSVVVPPARILLETIAAPICRGLLNRAIEQHPELNVVDTIRRNIASDLYRYVPLGNPSDKNAKHQIGGVQVDGPGQTQVEVRDYELTDHPVLHYPHTQGSAQVAELLNKTHTPLECNTDLDTGDYSCEPIKGPGLGYDPTSCQFVQSKSNPGDKLTFKDAGVATQLLVENVITVVSRIECQNGGEIGNWMEMCNGQTQSYDPNLPSPPPDTVCNPLLHNCYPQECTTWPMCEAEILITIPTFPKIPFAKQIWNQTVLEKTSAFRKIFPKIEEGAPVDCIAQIPGESDVNYHPSTDTNLVKVQTAGPNTYTGTEGKLFFPFLGSIYEYFLSGIQTALRPKGLSSQITQTGDTTGITQIIDGSSDKCILKPFECKDVAKEYGIPECQLQAIMALESGYDPTSPPTDPLGGTGACVTTGGRTFDCCTGIGCGPAQITCSQIDSFSGGEDIDVCDPCGAATLLARAMLLKLCIAADVCTSHNWAEWGNLAENFGPIEDGNYVAACYFHGLQNGCYPSGCTQYRWGEGMSYGDAVGTYCDTGALPPDANDPRFCEACSEEVVRSGLPPLQCSATP